MTNAPTAKITYYRNSLTAEIPGHGYFDASNEGFAAWARASDEVRTARLADLDGTYSADLPRDAITCILADTDPDLTILAFLTA
jgi:hypothetical protein